MKTNIIILLLTMFSVNNIVVAQDDIHTTIAYFESYEEKEFNFIIEDEEFDEYIIFHKIKPELLKKFDLINDKSLEGKYFEIKYVTEIISDDEEDYVEVLTIVNLKIIK